MEKNKNQSIQKINEDYKPKPVTGREYKGDYKPRPDTIGSRPNPTPPSPPKKN